jgi:hypothetical protein
MDGHKNSVTNHGPSHPKPTLGHGNKNNVINNGPSHPKPTLGLGNKNSVINNGPSHPKTYTRSWEQEQCNKQWPKTYTFGHVTQNIVTNHGPSQSKPTFGKAKLLALYFFKAAKSSY